MAGLTIAGGLPQVPESRGGTDPRKVHDAAQQFEALLMGQLLRSVRQGGTGWLGSDADASGECATDFAEQQFAAVLAQQGGLGLANLVARGLGASSEKQVDRPPGGLSH